jgi:hypothetical protein
MRDNGASGTIKQIWETYQVVHDTACYMKTSRGIEASSFKPGIAAMIVLEKRNGGPALKTNMVAILRGLVCFDLLWNRYAEQRPTYLKMFILVVIVDLPINRS